MIKFEDLIEEIAAGCKDKDSHKIGLELERFAFNKNNNAPLPYRTNDKNAPSIENLLNKIANADGWQKIFEDGFVIALKKENITITIEPAGQIEYAGSPLFTVGEVAKEAKDFHKKIDKIADEINIGFLAKGLHPNWARDDIFWMPKKRYEIMKNYMPKQGKCGIDMMVRSCGAQLNLDFENEEDMIKKYRISLALQPVIIALMANSNMLDGKDTGYASYRNYIWENTDKNRASFPKFVFDKDMGFEKYVEYALNIPMYLIYRDGKYIDMTSKIFAEFMQDEKADILDWQLHLTTVFPPVRLKKYLELRTADSNSLDMVLAMVAFWVGILYDGKILDKAYNIIMSWSVDDIMLDYKNASKFGVPAIAEKIEEFLEIAKEGLENQPLNKDSVEFLNCFYDIS